MPSPHLNLIQYASVGFAGMLLAYFENTTGFLVALILGFTFNILAGFRADDVKIKMWRLCNFNGNKLWHSLTELFLIVVITYFLKLIADLMNQEERSIYIVECLIWAAIYYYVRNALRNLSSVYTDIRWLRFVYYLISFQFKEFAPKFINKAWDASKDKKLKEDENEIL